VRRLIWAAVFSAAVYVSVFVANAHGLITDIQTSSDAVSPMTMAQTLAMPGHHGHVYTVQSAYVLVDLLTAWIPFCRGLWTAIPFVIYLATMCLVWFTAFRSCGKWVGMVTACISISVAPIVYPDIFAQAFHGTTWLATALLAAMVVRWHVNETSISAKRLWIEAVLVGLFAGAAITSDIYLIVTGIVPLAFVMVLRWITDRRTVTRFVKAALLVLVVSGLTSGACFLALHDAGFSSGLPLAQGRGLASPSLLLEHVRLLVNGVANLSYAGDTHTELATPVFGGLVALLVLACFVLALVSALKLGKESWREKVLSTQAVYSTFWGCSAVAIVLAFFSGGEATDVTSVRYLYPLFLCFAILVAATAGRRKGLQNLVVTISILASLVGAFTVSTVASSHALVSDQLKNTASLELALNARGLTYGYANYWLSSGITWASNGEVTLRPATQTEAPCGGADNTLICRSREFSVAGWYTGSHATTFVVTDPALSGITRAPGAQLGTPTETFKVDRWTVYVYAGDVGNRFLGS
jgi:hypothetical protein